MTALLADSIQPLEIARPTLRLVPAPKSTIGSRLGWCPTEVAPHEHQMTRDVPRRANEFACAGCFYIWWDYLLADAEQMLCRDCVETHTQPPVPKG